MRRQRRGAASCSTARCSMPPAGGQPGDTGTLDVRPASAPCRSPPRSTARARTRSCHVPAAGAAAAGARRGRCAPRSTGSGATGICACIPPASAVRRRAASRSPAARSAADGGPARFRHRRPGLSRDRIDAATINRLIAEDHPVCERWITDEELAANPGLVRTMSVKPPTGTGPGAAGVDRRGREHRSSALRRHPCRGGPAKSAASGRQDREQGQAEPAHPPKPSLECRGSGE